MLLGEMIAVALQSIRANLFRGFLTMLGIIIGVSSVITMVALGTGAQRAMDEQIDSLGASRLSVRSSGGMHRGVGRAGATIDMDDADALARDLVTVSGVAPESGMNLQVKIGSKNHNLRIVGATPNIAEVQSYEIEYGQMYSEADEEGKRRVAVIGSRVPVKFDMQPEEMLGKEIYINNIAFRVIGVFTEKGSSGWRNSDEQIWVPIATGRFRLFGTDALELINVKVAPWSTPERAIVDIERVMRREHEILPGADNDFTISDPRQFFNVRQAATNIFAALLASIASISLIVGGIGIMNIMLVTVTERTREIGIRKALGATRTNIMMQFLVEAMTLCMLGGLIGILLGVGFATLMTEFIGWDTHVSPLAVGIAFAFSASIGLFFGIWPARKAARLDPIEALRYE